MCSSKETRLGQQRLEYKKHSKPYGGLFNECELKVAISPHISLHCTISLMISLARAQGACENLHPYAPHTHPCAREAAARWVGGCKPHV